MVRCTCPVGHFLAHLLDPARLGEGKAIFFCSKKNCISVVKSWNLMPACLIILLDETNGSLLCPLPESSGIRHPV
jgi:hypothetical protein